MNLTKHILLIFLLISNFVSSQNIRDKFITDSISPFYGVDNKISFDKLLKNIIQLEKDYETYEPDYRYSMLLESSFNIGNIPFFKEQLTILVEKYGFQVAYMKESESYYKSIMVGDLAKWFKEMYLEKHLIWLRNNFDKQIGLRKLNALHDMDQKLTSFANHFNSRLDLDYNQSLVSSQIKAEYVFKNLGVLHGVSNLNKAYPTGKSFALVQNPFFIVELSNMQVKENFNRFYILFFDLYRKAYLKNDIHFGKFSDIDLHCFFHFGFQKFGLLSKELVLKSYIKEEYENRDFMIPIFDKNFSDQLKKEFRWDNSY